MMEENILIKSEPYNVKKFLKIMIIIGIIGTLVMILLRISSVIQYYDRDYEIYLSHQSTGCGILYDGRKICPICEQVARYSSKSSYTLASLLSIYSLVEFWAICFIPVAALSLIGGLVYFWLRSYELTVTDKRIYGKVAWGKRVDLPVDSVSAIASLSLFKGVSVSTSSGRISFRVIKNADKIYEVINNLLIERQHKKVNETIPVEKKNDETDQLRKFKELLDLGVITQEEFDAKKKQLLGL